MQHKLPLFVLCNIYRLWIKKGPMNSGLTGSSDLKFPTGHVMVSHTPGIKHFSERFLFALTELCPCFCTMSNW